MEAARTVKDVSPHDFVKAYAAHLQRSGKVLFFSQCLINSGDSIRVFESQNSFFFPLFCLLRLSFRPGLILSRLANSRNFLRMILIGTISEPVCSFYEFNVLIVYIFMVL